MFRQSVDSEVEEVDGRVGIWEVDADVTVVVAFLVGEGFDEEVLLLSKGLFVRCGADVTVSREDGVTIEVDFSLGTGVGANELVQVY